MIRILTGQFFELQRLWYSKLRDEGFSDIEKPDCAMPSLMTWHHAYFQKRYTVRQFKNKQRYYELAAQFAFDHRFESDRDRQIWILHSEGLPVRRIAERLNLKVCQAHKNIVSLRKLMMRNLFQIQAVEQES